MLDEYLNVWLTLDWIVNTAANIKVSNANETCHAPITGCNIRKSTLNRILLLFSSSKRKSGNMRGTHYLPLRVMRSSIFMYSFCSLATQSQWAVPYHSPLLPSPPDLSDSLPCLYFALTWLTSWRGVAATIVQSLTEAWTEHRWRDFHALSKSSRAKTVSVNHNPLPELAETRE